MRTFPLVAVLALLNANPASAQTGDPKSFTGGVQRQFQQIQALVMKTANAVPQLSRWHHRREGARSAARARELRDVDGRLPPMALITRLLPLVLAAGSQIAAPAAEPGFTSLFNGKDFTGWKIGGPAESFTIQDGAIVAKGATSHCYYDGSFRSHSFRNFELKVDVMTHAGSNGGVYVLTEFQETGGNVRATGRFPSKGFEIQVNNSHTDGIKTGSLYHVADILDQSPAQDDEWFTEHIIVRGDTITVRVDDKQVVHWTQPPDWDGGREGPGRRITGPGTIALQCHDPNSTVRYKNIRIKALD